MYFWTYCRDILSISFGRRQTLLREWFDEDYLGIDQGLILIQFENYRSGFVLSLMKKNPYIEEGL
jgi:hypothetical protein